MGDLIERVLHALSQPTIREALAVGAGLAVLVAVWARRSGCGRGSGRSVPWAGGVVLVAMAAVLARRGALDPAAAIGAGVVGVVVASSLRRHIGLTLGASGCGALLVAFASPVPAWARVAVAVTSSLGAVAAAETDRRWQHEAIGPALLLVAAIGIFCAVPDTAESGALMGAAMAAAALGWPLRVARLGGGWAAAVVALSAWAVAVGGRGRPLSVLGGLACLGLLVAWPMGRRIARDLRLPARAAVPALVIIAQLGVVAVASRVAGISFDPAVAVPVAAASAVAAVAASAVLGQAR